MNLSQIKSEYNQRLGKASHIQEQLDTTKSGITLLEKDQINYEKALTLFRETAQSTQREIEKLLADICTMALEAVFDDPYELQLEFVQRRDKTECDIWFVKDGHKINPLQASGLGPVDVASFALRIASWFIAGRVSRNVMLLDEPFKHLKGLEANRRVIEMVKEISEKMGLQIIMISDERVPKEDIVSGADKVFEVTQKDGVSLVMVLEG